MFLDAAAAILDLPGLNLLEFNLTPNAATLTATIAAEFAQCPWCQTVSRRVHGHYLRQVADLPWGPRSLTLRLQVRRFLCGNAACRRKTFTEQLPAVVLPSARRTQRLHQTLAALAFDLGGEVGARMAPYLHYGQPSADTLLRLMRRAPQPQPPIPRCLGVDDWAMKKGRTYGTLLCDLERHQVVDLLPDRESTTLANWLQAHPGVEIITRDRAGTYAEGAKQGAPAAVQIADRFHLLTNLTGALKQVVEHHRAALRLPAPEATTPLAPPNRSGESVALAPPTTPGTAGLAQRQANYQAVQALQQQGLTVRQIAQQLQLAINTVLKYLRLPEPPTGQRRTSRKLLRFETFFYKRWDEGERSPRTLWAELRQQGFRGSYRSVARYVAELRGPLPVAEAAQAPAAPPPQLTVSQAVRLLVLAPEALTQEQQVQLAQLQQASAPIAQAYDLAHRFQDMVRNRRPEVLLEWVKEAQASHLPGLSGFALSLKKDWAAVLAALSFIWSNGPTEGQVNRLKQIKRQMYGRGKLDLLKRRVMHYGADP